jgi:hypothetical protein
MIGPYIPWIQLDWLFNRRREPKQDMARRLSKPSSLAILSEEVAVESVGRTVGTKY